MSDAQQVDQNLKIARAPLAESEFIHKQAEFSHLLATNRFSRRICTCSSSAPGRLPFPLYIENPEQGSHHTGQTLSGNQTGCGRDQVSLRQTWATALKQLGYQTSEKHRD